MTRVVVVGCDAPLWLVALALRRALAPAGVTLTVVELPSALALGDVYATLPAIEALHARIGIEEAALLRATGGVFSLGTNMTGPETQPFLLPWGSHGAPIDGTPFFPAWLRARAQGLDARLQDFSLTGVAAANGRVMLGDANTAGFARTDYGYALPARDYVGFLKGLAAHAGIPIVQTRDLAVARSGETIASITLDGGQVLAGNLFIDTSGDAAALADADDAVEGWSDRFPARWRVSARAPGLRSLPSYLEQRALRTGWLRLHPTPAATLVTAVTDDMPDETVLAELQDVAGLPLADVVAEPLTTRRQIAAWRGNCVAIGAAACAVDPVFGLELQVAQLGLVHLLSLFPNGADAGVARAEYNRRLASHYDRVADTQQALYALAPWPGAFWDRARAAPVSATLAHKIAAFRARGQVAPMEDETFDETIWQALLVGLGAIPESWPPAADRLAPDTMKTAFRGMFGFIRETVLAQPTHDAYLAGLRGDGPR